MKRQAIQLSLVAAVALAAAAVHQSHTQDAAAADASGATDNKLRDSNNPFVQSHIGTLPDGQLRVEGVSLVLSEALIARFEYFLSAVGERPLPHIYAEIERNIQKELALEPAAAAEAKRIFRTYIEFKTATKSLPVVSADDKQMLSAIRNRFEAERTLRARYFSAAESAALFGSNDFTADDALARMEINANPNLSTAQKQAQLAELDANLPAEVRAWRAPQASMDALQAAEKEARTRGASAAEMLAVRTGLVGAEAARNLAALDQENADFERRVNAFKSEKDKILANAQLSEPERLASIEGLRNREFRENEQFLLHAYEQQ